MEIVISKKLFLRGLARTASVADKKSSLPILANVLLSTDGTSGLRFAGTDLYLGVTTTTPCDVHKEGSVAVSAKTLFDIVKQLPEGDVIWTVGPNHAAEIRAGKVRFRVPGMPGTDFPQLPVPGSAEFIGVDADTLADLVAKTHYAMSTDDTRQYLAGTLFEGELRTLRMVTTDGHRLSKIERELPEGSMAHFSMLVPSKGIGELKRLIEDARAEAKAGKDDASRRIEVASAGGHAFFRREGTMLSVKLAEEQFLPYARAIPTRQDKRVIVSRAALIDSLRRMILVSSETSGGVRFMVSAGSMRIVSENPDVGEGSEELDVDYAGEPLTIGFNAKYMLDALGSLHEDEVVLELSGELDPGVIKPHSDTQFIGVVMPMRI